jgi:hypothetical protein
MPTLRSQTRAALTGAKTLHPVALRKMGIVVPEPEPPMVVAAPTFIVNWDPYTPGDYDDYSPTSPRRD